MKPKVIVYESFEEYANVQEGVEIMKMVEKRKKKDNGKRYSLDDLETKIKLQEFFGDE